MFGGTMLIMPLVLVISAVLYGFTLLFIPFNPTAANVALFTLIAFWSRLPGNAFNDPTWILYCLDLIDLLSMVIAINMGGIYGGIFAAVTNIVPRFCGFYPAWMPVLYDAFAQFIVCLFIPLIHAATGGIVFNTMIYYTVLRVLILVPLSFVLYPRPLAQWLFEWVTSMFGIFFANGLWAKIFGEHFDNFLRSHSDFDWLLFLVASMITISFYIFVMNKNDRTHSIRPLVNKILRKVISPRRQLSKISEQDILEQQELRKIREDIFRKG